MTDSRIDTYQHIALVQGHLTWLIQQLQNRALGHDASKLIEPERAAYDEIVPRLAVHAYGSEEYRATLREMKTALDHHFEHNPHHPEHWGERGVNGMTLVDLVEMICDWAAASQRPNRAKVDADRYPGEDMVRAMDINRGRFGLSEQLVEIILNTYRAMGVVKDGEHYCTACQVWHHMSVWCLADENYAEHAARERENRLSTGEQTV